MAKPVQPTITVDENFVRVGGKSYATNKITSVEVREYPTNPRGCASMLMGLGFIGLLGSLAFPPLLIFAIPMVALGVVIHRKANIKKYQLYLITSAAEQHALDTEDGDMVYGLRDQIEAAMIKSAGQSVRAV